MAHLTKRRILSWARRYYLWLCGGVVAVGVLGAGWAMTRPAEHYAVVAPNVSPDSSQTADPASPSGTDPGRVQGEASSPSPYPARVLGLSYFELTLPVAS